MAVSGAKGDAEIPGGTSSGHAAAGEQPVEVATTAQVLFDEYERIWPGRGRPTDEQDYEDRVRRGGQAALCLSGGGIRSAAFALGVLQALSRKGLLTRFNYLSTVSGGGYIGGWLQRWIHERGDADTVMAALAADIEPVEVKALRENSNFITPRVGVRSNDTWTAIATSLRNITVNWLLFAPLFLLITIFPNLVNALVDWLATTGREIRQLVYVAHWAAGLCAAVSAWFTVRGLPSYRPKRLPIDVPGDYWLSRRIVWWLVGWAVCGTLSLAGEVLPPGETAVQPLWGWQGLAFAASSYAGMILGLLASGLSLGRGDPAGSSYRKTFVHDIPLWLSAGAVVAAIILLASDLFAWMRDLKPIHDKLLTNSNALENKAVLLTIAMPILFLVAHIVGGFVVAAFRRARVAAVDSDADREWLARLSAVKIKAMLFWLIITFAALLLGVLLQLAQPGQPLSLTGTVALVSGTIAALGGRSQRSGGATGNSAVAAVLRYLPLQAIIAVATFVFALALFTVFATLEQGLAERLSEPGKTAIGWLVTLLPRGPLADFNSVVAAHLVIAAVLWGVLAVLGRYIPVNRFSLNGFYRNRLARAFLGAARPKRCPDSFTGFDSDDNVELNALAPAGANGPVLYPVVNVTLNVTKSDKLAWQERKAEPFILTPLWCGSCMLTPEGTPEPGPDDPPAPAPGAYISALNYGGSEPGLIMPGHGISLAMSMSISGAAASPNMGYHSAPATAFLMTLFNVRLGAWLPNPARARTLGKRVYQANPCNSVRALMRELEGATDDKDQDIYLSDGGHFENLGLYEMVRRRCRYIVLSDAGADPECAFTDLGNAVRKIKIDMSVEIRFEQLRISSRAKPINPQYAWALGRIYYPDCLRADGSIDEDKIGHLLYIKPSFFGDLPVDVRSYASGSESFPHESTADQFFSESQFESYRNLGFWFARTLGGEAKYEKVGDFFAAIEAEHAKEKAKHADADGGGVRRSLRSWLGLGG